MIQRHRYKGVTNVAKWLFFLCDKSHQYTAKHDSKEIIFNITPHKFEKNSHLHLLIFTSKFSNIKEVRQD